MQAPSFQGFRIPNQGAQDIHSTGESHVTNAVVELCSGCWILAGLDKLGSRSGDAAEASPQDAPEDGAVDAAHQPFDKPADQEPV